MKNHMIVLFVLLTALLAGCTGLKGELAVSPVSEETLDLGGYWEGTLTITPANELTLGFSISVAEDGLYQAMLQIPTQGLRDFPVSSVTFGQDVLTIGIEPLHASFSGTYDGQTGQIVGTFVQMGQSLPLVLLKGEQKRNVRPQDPQKPYPYISEDITFSQAPEGFLLAGTITRPQGEGPFPAVVLISGSGSQNRDGELMGHRPFLVLADALTRSGIVVLRYDDRGFVLSQGDASTATSLDFADDAESAVDHLETLAYVDADAIGIIGHSEGAIIGPIVAQRRPDVSFLVLMAGPGVDGVAVLEDQTAAILRAQQAPEAAIEQVVRSNLAIYATVLDETRTMQERKSSVLQTLLSLGMTSGQAQAQIPALFSLWYMTFLALDPSTYLQELDIPVMILNGTKDTQVSASLHVPAIEAALLSGGNSRYTTKVYEGLNHLFQPALTGSPDEYATIETTIDPQVLDDISSWIVRERFQL
ncbi:MAG: alpha/beta hydrolase [Sphaerochaeta sp.]|nr:alpha/beta hydrolase [Sphaerochaeta sp.]